LISIEVSMGSPAENREIKSTVEEGRSRSGRIQRARGLQKKLVRAALIAAVAMASVHAARIPDAAAGSFSTVVQVNAVVLARTQLTPLRQPAMLVVTEADIERGYVEVSGASLFEIWNNNPAGCVLTFAPSDFPFREVTVTVMGREVIINPMGGMVVMPIKGRQQIALDYRFDLTREAQPGTYAWPLSVSANPL
jgi:hypothetical protein